DHVGRDEVDRAALVVGAPSSPVGHAPGEVTDGIHAASLGTSARLVHHHASSSLRRASVARLIVDAGAPQLRASVSYGSIRHMKTTTVFLYETTECDLKALARQQGRPVADMIREAIAEYVTREKGKARRPLRFLGIGRSGHTDTAERHEELLFTELDAHGGA